MKSGLAGVGLGAFFWLVVMLCPMVRGADADPMPILAPFGLSWGLIPEDVEKILSRFKFPIVAKVQQGNKLRVEVSGIPQKNLLRTIFHFEDGILYEVELRLGHPKWAAADYNRLFMEAKRVLDSRYGRGFPLVLEKRKEGDIETFLGGYYWTQYGGSIRLFIYHANNASEEAHILSEHYRAY